MKNKGEVMKKMKLSVKLIGGFLIVGFITLIVGFLGWKGVSQTDEALTEVAVVRLPSVLGLEMMNQAQTAIQRAERSLLIPEFFRDEKEKEHQYKRAEGAWKNAENGWKIYEPLPQTKEEEGIWNNFKPAWDEWKKDHNKVIELVKSGNRDEAFAYSNGKARESLRSAEKLLNDLIELNVRVADEFAKPAMAQADRSKFLSLVGMVLGTAIALVLGVFLSLSITRPIVRITEGLSEGAEQVAAASGQVSSASQQLAEGSSQQAAAIEETSSSLEEMSSMTRQNAQHATEANQLMSEAKQVINQATESMGQLKASMGEISRASEETSKIIKTIDEIAFQTNLLALNAAVEAARAGEAGAGFAVVADEVRNLAMRAAEAAKNTANLIEGTVKRVKEGSDIVGKTSTEFSQVASSAVKMGELVGEITAASQEQAQGIEQINKAVNEMDKVVQQTAANAEESASASEEMNAQAEQLKSYAEELVNLIGGSANASHKSLQQKSAGRRLHSRGVVPNRGKTLPHITKGRKKGNGKELVAYAQGRKDPHPERVIPLEEDGEFSDF
jgi:methyl-accepting chemotaxis protein